jgi:hypothetical protein
MLHTGEKIIIVGLFLQIAFFGLFIVVATIFHRRYHSKGVTVLQSEVTIWRRHMQALYWGSGLIMVRSIFRVVEYLMGNNGFLLRHEYFLYIFDAALMTLLMLGFLFVHPSQLSNARHRPEEEMEQNCQV